MIPLTVPLTENKSSFAGTEAFSGGDTGIFDTPGPVSGEVTDPFDLSESAVYISEATSVAATTSPESHTLLPEINTLLPESHTLPAESHMLPAENPSAEAPGESLASINGIDVAFEALSHLGLAYSDGGRSFETGVDCSGFTSLCYERFGVSLPSSPLGQYSAGRSISESEAGPGDIVVCLYGSESIYQGHCGIIIGRAPNGHIITVSAHPDITNGMDHSVSLHQIDGYYGNDRQIRRVVENTYPYDLGTAWDECVAWLSKSGAGNAISDWRYYDDLGQVAFSGNVFGYNNGGYIYEGTAESITGSLRLFMDAVEKRTGNGCVCSFTGYYMPTGKIDEDGFEILSFVEVMPVEKLVIKGVRPENAAKTIRNGSRALKKGFVWI